MRRIVQDFGQRAATVMSPRGGVMAASGSISSTPSKPQKEDGKRGQIMRTRMLGPSGGKAAGRSTGIELARRDVGNSSCMGLFSERADDSCLMTGESPLIQMPL